MRCPRCQGLMTADWLIGGGEDAAWRAWRCVNCGDVRDAVIARHRQVSTRANPPQTEEPESVCAAVVPGRSATWGIRRRGKAT